MSIRLNVPLVTQQRQMSCWYASACMVAYFREAGPRQGLPAKWNANNGIQLSDFIKLAEVEGLQSVRAPAQALSEQAFSDRQLEVLL